ncbi:neuronal membrane glycoprotein M6-b [Ciona intestinalis]
MSVHSLHDLVEAESYQGYNIDRNGEVTEFYDHRNEDGTNSISTARHPLVTTSQPATTVAPTPKRKKVRYRDAGCCDGCVNCLITIGTMPFGTAFAVLLCWLGTAMFIGGGWSALDGTMDLWARFGPLAGNPYNHPAPQYLYTGNALTPQFISLNRDDLGNRVPDVFQAIKYSFYGLIPFMFVFTIMLACDNRHSSRAMASKKRTCKSSSSGICLTAALIGVTYILVLAWVFFLAFTTLGVYYYRISMLRCSDLQEREFSTGVLKSVCIDLVQLGVMMFKNTNDNGFGKLCGPGDNMQGYGQLEGYCQNYYVVYQYMLVAFSGCLLNIIAMVNFIMILTINYNDLTRKRNAPTRPTPSAAPSQASTTPIVARSVRSIPNTSVGPPPYVVSNRDYERERLNSKDIELDYMLDSASSYERPREEDSHMGVNYYYRR